MAEHPLSDNNRQSARLRMPGATLRLLGGFELSVNGEVIDLPLPSQRLLAYLALQPRPRARVLVRAALWPDTADHKAAACLRTALWRINTLAGGVVAISPSMLGVHPELEIDCRVLEATAATLAADGPAVDAGAISPSLAGAELLPEMWDAWLVFERDRLRELGLQMLEGLSRRLTRDGDPSAAVLAAMAAVAVEPLRETANRVLVEAYLAQGNVVDAVRRYRQYADRLRAELQTEPQPSFRTLVFGTTAQSRLSAVEAG